MKARTPAARAAASLVLAGALLVGTAGCTFISNQATLIRYDPSDGVGTTVGTIDVRNAIVLVSDDGSTASLLVTLVNTGQRAVDLKIQYLSGGLKTTNTATVKAGDVVSFGNTPEQEKLIIDKPEQKPGALLPIYLQYGDEPGKELLVPVLTAEGNPAYETLIPTNAPTPTPTPTRVITEATPLPTPEPTETPAP